MSSKACLGVKPRSSSERTNSRSSLIVFRSLHGWTISLGGHRHQCHSRISVQFSVGYSATVDEYPWGNLASLV